MNTLFPIDDFKRVTFPNIELIQFPYFCVGFYTHKKWWKIFETMWKSEDSSDMKRFIKEKEDNGWIIFICKLPDFTKVKQDKGAKNNEHKKD